MTSNSATCNREFVLFAGEMTSETKANDRIDVCNALSLCVTTDASEASEELSRELGVTGLSFVNTAI